MKSNFNYIPVNYNTWINGGKGKNIESLLSKKHWEIWKKALPFQDTRDDVGHGEFVTFFAYELLKYLPGEKNIVIPAAILHDIGYQVSPEKFRKLVSSDKELYLRMKHQIIGERKTFEILKSIKYPEKYMAEIQTIIVDHDTRIFKPSLNEKILRDADLLWRFTKPCIDSYYKNKSAEENLEIMEKEILKLYTLKSKKIAKIELCNTMFYVYPEKYKNLLKYLYPKELKKVASFYK